MQRAPAYPPLGQHSWFDRARQSTDRYFHVWALLPAALLLLGLTLYPIVQLVMMSVSEIGYTGNVANWQFVGLRHFRELAADPIVPVAFRNTLVFVVGVVLAEVVLGLVLALAVSRSRRLAWLYRPVLLLPILIPGIAIGTMWRLMYDTNYGIINSLLAGLGIVGPTWTADPALAMLSVMIVDVWHWTSFTFLILLAGVESMPDELREAARVDGANETQTLRFIVLPLLAPTIMVVTLLRAIGAFKVFDEIYLLTGGGPGTVTEVIALQIEKILFEQGRLGYGSALALVTAAVTTVFIVIFLRLARRRTA